jgi:small conductance mechanosensitive channel
VGPSPPSGSGHTGIVRDISLRAVHVRSGDGRDIFIPCAQIFTNPLINFTRDGLRRGDFVIGVDYRHDPGQVRELLLRTVQRSRGVLTDPATAVLVSEFHASYQELRVFFWVDTRGDGNLGQIRSYLMRACVNALKEADIVLSSDVTTAVVLEPVKVDLPPRS